MQVLEYREFTVPRDDAQYRRVVGFLERDDFKSAEVKKLAPTAFYRAKLNDRDRLLFKIFFCHGQRYALALEYIENHAYDKSRFLRGAKIDETKIPDFALAAIKDEDLERLPYVNAHTRRFNVLDKMICFDDAQEATFHANPPLIIIGSAGSGKTALALEKVKLVAGDVLYVTQSPFLAQHARHVYFAHGYEAEHQSIEFLSMREYCETVRVPAGKEVDYRLFKAWFPRQQRGIGLDNAHKVFEEFRGVLTGTTLDAAYLSAQQYRDLGVKQSVFLDEERPRVYGLFEKYLRWLKDESLYDHNILAYEYLNLVTPKYDFVAVDEVQDLTNVQLALLLRSLKQPGQFLLSGDSNQIVHPNFFSWAKVKSLFYTSDLIETGQATRILQTNYRNSTRITELANRLLKVKQKRFGSIDRESNYLVTSASAEAGTVDLLADQDALIKTLNDKTKKSTRFAVLVLREEQKAEAQQRFQTPLVFSVQEAKGLEYENVILYRFISGERANFATVAEDISSQDIASDLSYNRGKDKTDKSLEVYKFYVNSFYVAITRAIRNLYVIESDVQHPLLRLLDLLVAKDHVNLGNEVSTAEDWQREARKLELQGKVDQAAAIRTTILHEKKVPWEILDADRFRLLARQVLDPRNISGKARQLCSEYVAYYDEPGIAQRLGSYATHVVPTLDRECAAVRKKYWQASDGKHFKEVLRDTELYGVDFRNRFNQTPLMIAAQLHNLRLVEALLERGANPSLHDNYGRTAFHLAWQEALRNERRDSETIAVLFSLLSPESISLRINTRLIKLDAHIIEYFVFNAMLATFKKKYDYADGRSLLGFSTANLLQAFAPLPPQIMREERKRRPYLSGVLARNELARDYPYNRHLFLRMRQGYYVFNPAMDVKVQDTWISIYELIQLPQMLEHSHEFNRFYLGQLSRVWQDAVGNPAPPAATSQSFA